MKKNILLTIVMWTVILFKVQAQSVTVDARIDSLQILIGEQAQITLEVALDADKRTVFPIYTDTLVRNVEVLNVSQPDTQYLNDRKRLLIKQEYTITSFDSALYYLPPMEVLVENKPYYSQALALKVYSIPVDTLHPDEFNGPKNIMQPDFVWEDWYATIACVLLWVPVLLLLIYLIKRIRDNKPIIRKVKVEPKLPPHVLAIQEIDRIKKEKSWLKEDPKVYYTDLTEVIRVYIGNRFGFNALEMTSGEIIDKLLEFKDKEAIKDLKFLFQTADLVKFAKYTPLMNENDSNLINAIGFINDTQLPEEENAEAQPTEITIIEKRPLRTKIVLAVAIVLAITYLLISLIYIITELYSYWG